MVVVEEIQETLVIEGIVKNDWYTKYLVKRRKQRHREVTGLQKK